jgi:nuclear pore complex protein Nup155
MLYPSIKEAERYTNELLPLKSEIYQNGSSLYSNLKTTVLRRDFTVPDIPSNARSGILPEINMVWYTSPSKLHLYRYDMNTIEDISNFSTDVQFVRCFEPVKGIFNSKIAYCILVITDNEAIIYGIEKENFSIINTEFSVKLSSRVSCVEISCGNIYLGCIDNNIYQAMYKSIDIFNYKHMNLYCPSNFIVKTFNNIFTRKSPKITHMSVGKKFLVALSKNLQIYNIENGIYKINSINISESYTSVQIIEENPLLFCCTRRGGIRDFYSKSFMFSKDFPLVDNAQVNQQFFSTPLKFLSIRRSHDSSLLVLASFNEDHLRNFSKIKPVENYETIAIHSPINSVILTDQSLMVLTERKLSVYEIYNSKKIILASPPQENYTLYKNYGDVEFLIKYYELLAENEDVSKLEGLCKNDSIKNHALFVFIYNLVKPVWRLDVMDLKMNGIPSANIKCDLLDDVSRKLENLKNKIGTKFEEARSFIDMFVQTNFYVSLLVDHNIAFKETFESILSGDSQFKNNTLKMLLDVFSCSSNVDPLIKNMKANCPLYLPLDQINYQRGLELIRKGSRENLLQSLEFFKMVKLENSTLKKFNSLNFYYGSAYLIREHFDFSYEEAVALFTESIKCKKAMDYCLNDSRENFLYPLFEALLNLKDFERCICCDCQETLELIKIDNPVFRIFLKDSRNEKAVTLYWKYLLYRGCRVEATEALIALSQRQDLDLAAKVDFLQTALSISTGTYLNSEIKMRLKLYSIQCELLRRSKSLNITQLLSADSLFNDYCYKHYDLSIKILDAINFQDKAVIKETYVKYFKLLTLEECFSFLKQITNKDLDIVLDILISKINNEPNFCNESEFSFCKKLVDVGFDHKDVVHHIRGILMNHGHPNIKLYLLNDFQGFADFKDFKECKQYCETVCGIKINK